MATKWVKSKDKAVIKQQKVVVDNKETTKTNDERDLTY